MFRTKRNLCLFVMRSRHRNMTLSKFPMTTCIHSQAKSLWPTQPVPESSPTFRNCNFPCWLVGTRSFTVLGIGTTLLKLGISWSLGENCALATNQSADCHTTTLFTISLNYAKVWNRGFNWSVFSVGMHKKSPNGKSKGWKPCSMALPYFMYPSVVLCYWVLCNCVLVCM